MERIKKIASFCQGSKVVCDIGCDHAYALIYAILEYGVEKGIAADVAKGPLLNAKKMIEEYHLDMQIKTILSDGFVAIEKDSFDTAILAGMGGILICDILKRALPKLKNKKLIIEANSDTYLVRSLLFSNGFTLIAEDALYDHGKYYEILVFEKGNSNYNQLDIMYGPHLRKIKPEAFIKYYQKKLDLLSSIIPQIKDEKEKEEKHSQIKEIQDILEG
ncbi:MAG: class I SAM-dependent methyltransferase [Roseburia sp.]|nr:class I SAM-dependent methyltransferase [Anaeroplasma bactoclasticum]MCM1195877.1 class I SAM-dependent methyltransferase [Roseburia sp.]MCM1556535.1 class I SAM-dependent methyltransferase [Anaeroplasma bactoclasticum]